MTLKSIFYGIASYHRPDCRTLETLLRIGIDPDRITLSLNDLIDYGTYKARHTGKARIIYGPGKGVACNRNNLLNSYKPGDYVVILDDDIKNFKRYTAGGKYGKLSNIETAAELDRTMRECFDLAACRRIPFFGFFSTGNQMMITSAVQNDGQYSINRMYQGGFCGFIVDGRTRYDEGYLVLDDYEIILRGMVAGRDTFRRNDVIADKPPMGGAKGGYYDLYRQGIQQRYMIKLLQQYRGIFTVNKGFSGIRLKPSFTKKIKQGGILLG